MNLVDYESRPEQLTIFLKGHIDSNNSPEVETRILEILQEEPNKPLVLDLSELEYISSAGLRIILRLRKDRDDLKVIEVNPEVYEIFSMTGFTEMMEVEKAYRRISVDGCEVIGKGANGVVYRIDPDTIVKVYSHANALSEIKQERELARKAFVKGIPTAISYDVVRVGDYFGSVFELLNAESFAKILIQEPDRFDEVVKMSADLLLKIHSTTLQPGELPDMKQKALSWAEFSEPYLAPELYKKLHALFEAVPEDCHMLHGDYHVKNVMLQNGEVLLIDMDTLCMGHPIFEFGSIYNAYRGFSLVDHDNIKGFLGIDYETAWKFLWDQMKYYLGTEDEARIQEVIDKAEIVGITRLLRRSIRRGGLENEEGRAAIAFYETELARLLPVTDTLCF